MFTGIVESIGTIRRATVVADGTWLVIAAPELARELDRGDSVSVDGVCLTATSSDRQVFQARAVPETIASTTLGNLGEGDRVNLELPLRADGRLGGHVVQGHIDGVGEIRQVVPEGDGSRVTVGSSPEILRYVVHKGSVAVDGVSLTVAARTESGFEVALIPQTLEMTTLGRKSVGDRVNLEVDIMAKYVEALFPRSG